MIFGGKQCGESHCFLPNIVVLRLRMGRSAGCDNAMSGDVCANAAEKIAGSVVSKYFFLSKFCNET